MESKKVCLHIKILILLILLLSLATFGQTARNIRPCLLSNADAPVLRGLKFGMTSRDVGRVLDTEIKIKLDGWAISLKKVKDKYVQIYAEDLAYSTNERKIATENGHVTIYREIEKLPKLAGISFLSLRFYKDSLYAITINYDIADYNWKNAKEFLLANEEKMNLPKGLWSGQPRRDIPEVSRLDCSGFTAYVSIEPESVFLDITDTTTEKLINLDAIQLYVENLKRIENEKLEKRRTFKP
jgi:hypothetical protein